MSSSKRRPAPEPSPHALPSLTGLSLLLAATVSAAELPFDVGTTVAGFQEDFRGAALSAGWQPTGSALGVYTVAAGVLRVQSAGGDPNHLLWMGSSYDSSTQEVLARVRILDFGTGDPARGGLGVAVDPGTSHGINLHFRDVNESGQTGRHFSLLDDLRAWGPAQALSWENGTWYWLRLRHEPDAAGGGGIDVFAKVWPADGVASEPAGWLTWDYTAAHAERAGAAGITAGSADGLSEFEVDYVLIKADGLPDVVVAPDAFPLVQVGATILTQPTDLTLMELEAGVFEVVAEGNPAPGYQWFRNGGAIPGATNATYALTSVTLADDQTVFRVRISNTASNVLYTVTSSNALLRVTPDRVPPELLNAQAMGLIQVMVAFSEPLDAATAANVEHYTLTAPGETVQILSATPDASERRVTLTVPPLVDGQEYTLTVNGLTDQAEARNPVDPGSQATFTTAYEARNIGSDTFAGVLTPVPGGYDVQAAGTGLVGTSDDCFFASQPRMGDFDMRVRVEALGPGDVWAQAGLMARESSAGDALFAAVFATPSNVGSGFLARTAPGGQADPTGLFPANYPYTWLRLRREGDRFTGYAALDGVNWMRLGTADILLAETLELGFVTASHEPGRPIPARFRDWTPVIAPAVLRSPPPREVPGQASRSTPFAITEIQYHPAAPEGSALEFVELFNPFGTPEDLSGYRLTGDIDYTFPDSTVLAPGAYLVVARDPATLTAREGITNVLGPFAGTLDNSGGTLRLRHRTGAVFLEVDYDTDLPWPPSTDGAGHSLVLARPTFGQNEPAAWAASDTVGGSPGRGDSVGPEPLRGLCLNEFLAHTDDPVLDYIELYNPSPLTLDISGCLISDNRAALASGALTNVFQIPDGTLLDPGEFLALDQVDLGFALNAAGETIYLMNPSRTRVLDAVRFSGQANGVSFGRYPDGAPDFSPLSGRTPGEANARKQLSPVVIHEILFNPASGRGDAEFVELHNRSGLPANVGGWRFTSGIDYTLPPATTIPPNGYLVVAANRTNLLARYPGILNNLNTVGDFAGSLDNGGERLALSLPEELVSTNSQDQVVTNLAWIVASEVTYRDGGRWSSWADGGGSSLELTDPRSDTRRAANWAPSDETGKAQWTFVDYTNRVELGETAANQLQILPLGAGEYLIDDVEVLDPNGNSLIANNSFASGASGWTAQGTLSGSSYEPTGGYGGGGCFHLRAVDRGDNQINRVRTPLTTPLSPGSTAVIRARVRWLRGHPEVIFRLRGRWLETLAPLSLPSDPGTPGQPNSRGLANAGPALFDITHFPVVPAVGDPVHITARVEDPDEINAVRLAYRVDPESTVTTVPMTDDGQGADAAAGDGLYSASLPGQAAGVLIAFRVEADDGATNPANSVFPEDAPAGECLVRWGDPVKPGNIPAYRLWMTQATFSNWSNRLKLDNTPSSVVFVQGNQRAIYNTLAQFAGSPYIAPSFSTPSGNRCGYSIEVPADDPFLGGTDLVLDWPGGHGNERTAVQEQMAYWVADRMGLPFSLRHYIRLHVNGVTDMQRGGVFEAIIQPARDFVRAWSPNDSGGDFYKIDRAFEFSDSGSLIADPMPTLQVFNGADGTKKAARYRWNWLRRSYDSADNFTNLFAWVDALNAAAPEPYTTQTTSVMNVEECMSMFAFEHIVVNFDSWGHNIGKNMYAYKPETGGWQIYAFDLDWLMLVSAGISGSYGPSSAPLFSSHDPTVARLYAHPPFRRAYFRAVQNAVDGPFLAAQCNPVMQAKYRWLIDEGVTRCDGATLAPPTAVEQWFATRRTFLLGQLDSVAATFGINGTTLLTTTNNPVVFTGSAPITVTDLAVNGITLLPTWTSATTWSLTVPLAGPGTNVLAFAGLDVQGNPIPGAATQVIVNFIGPDAPSWSLQVRFNEWMADNQATVLDPADARAEDWFELFNPGPGNADLSGFFLTDDLGDWNQSPLPQGTVIPAGGYQVVWADGEPEQNTNGEPDLHVNFQLSKQGETLGLFAPDGTLVDSVDFGLQAEDVSEGRYPDAGPLGGFLTRATPGSPNAAPYQSDATGPYLEPSVVEVVGDDVVLGWLALPGVTYQVEYKDDLEDLLWFPFGPPQTATAPVIRIRDLVSPTAHRFFRVVELPTVN